MRSGKHFSSERSSQFFRKTEQKELKIFFFSLSRNYAPLSTTKNQPHSKKIFFFTRGCTVFRNVDIALVLRGLCWWLINCPPGGVLLPLVCMFVYVAGLFPPSGRMFHLTSRGSKSGLAETLLQMAHQYPDKWIENPLLGDLFPTNRG